MRINYNFQRNILYKKDLNSTFAEENDYCMASKNLNRLKVVLAEKQRTNKWLAEQLGKDQTTISKWCTNSSQPDLGNLMQIAKILDVELTDLVRFEEFKMMEQNKKKLLLGQIDKINEVISTLSENFSQEDITNH